MTIASTVAAVTNRIERGRAAAREPPQPGRPIPAEETSTGLAGLDLEGV
jgi:hypothetical protein